MLLDPVDLLGATLGRYHVVKRGENLTLIAKRHGITVTNLKIWNGLTSDVIIPGQKLYFASAAFLAAFDDDQPAASEYHQMEKHHRPPQCHGKRERQDF